jgi:hypothetical protein
MSKYKNCHKNLHAKKCGSNNNNAMTIKDSTTNVILLNHEGSPWSLILSLLHKKKDRYYH